MFFLLRQLGSWSESKTPRFEPSNLQRIPYQKAPWEKTD